jgi:hypothetical protein
MMLLEDPVRVIAVLKNRPLWLSVHFQQKNQPMGPLPSMFIEGTCCAQIELGREAQSTVETREASRPSFSSFQGSFQARTGAARLRARVHCQNDADRPDRYRPNLYNLGASFMVLKYIWICVVWRFQLLLAGMLPSHEVIFQDVTQAVVNV